VPALCDLPRRRVRVGPAHSHAHMHRPNPEHPSQVMSVDCLNALLGTEDITSTAVERETSAVLFELMARQDRAQVAELLARARMICCAGRVCAGVGVGVGVGEWRVRVAQARVEADRAPLEAEAELARVEAERVAAATRAARWRSCFHTRQTASDRYRYYSAWSRLCISPPP
jgi:hypothetical protein